jgi:hypothetical protein
MGNLNGESLFMKWLARGPVEKRRLADAVIAIVVPVFEKAGFSSVKTDSYGRPQVNEMAMERCNDDGTVDIVSILFNKYRKPYFDVQVLRLVPPDYSHWAKNAHLVWMQDDDVRYKRWGPKWWQLDQAKAGKVVVERVRSLVPQLIDYLDDQKIGPNVRVWPTLRT